MITDKDEAIEEVKKDVIDFDNIDKSLLTDKEVATAYMYAHSSNKLLLMGFPIDITCPGIVDDANFIIDVIGNLEVEYSKENLNALLKLSALEIVKGKMNKERMYDLNNLKSLAREILTIYNEELQERNKVLSKKQTVLDEVEQFIKDEKLDGLDVDDKKRTKVKNNGWRRYKDCKVGFGAEL